MKKLVIILLGALLFTACGFDSTFRDEPEFESRIGLLSEKLPSEPGGGTHVLMAEGEEATNLNSLRINLSLNQYLKNKVEVTGVYHPDDEVFEVTGIKVLEVLSDDTMLKSFVVYKNTELGFKLKYYDDWEVSEGVTGIAFLAPNDDKITIEQFSFSYVPASLPDGTNDTPLSAYLAEDYENWSIRKIGVDQLNAAFFENIYVLYRSGFVYTISFLPADVDALKNQTVFNQMITEFQFTGFAEGGEVEPGEEPEPLSADPEPELISASVPTPDLKMTTFESLPYKFRGKYPASWYYAGRRSYDSNIMHHYGFAEESVTETNELISLDLLSGGMPEGQSLSEYGLNGVKSSSGPLVQIFVLDEEERVFKFSGAEEYADLILYMAAHIEYIED